MTDQTPMSPTDIDPAEAARKIEQAGIADESAAYSEAIDGGDQTPESDEPAAHPS